MTKSDAELVSPVLEAHRAYLAEPYDVYRPDAKGITGEKPPPIGKLLESIREKRNAQPKKRTEQRKSIYYIMHPESEGQIRVAGSKPSKESGSAFVEKELADAN